MNDSTDLTKGPSPGQIGQAGMMVAGATIRALEASNVNSVQLKNFTQDDANEIGTRIVREFFNIAEEKWFEEKKKISLFFKKFFKINVDWTKISIPTFDPKFKRIDCVPKELTCDQIFAAYDKTFGNTGNAYKSIDKEINIVQDRPKTGYVFGWGGTLEPDNEHLNKSYDDAIKAGFTFMTPIEGLISAFRYRFETGNLLDVKGVTRFSALDSGGNAMGMCRYGDGNFRVGRYVRGYRDSVRGPREVSF